MHPDEFQRLMQHQFDPKTRRKLMGFAAAGACLSILAWLTAAIVSATISIGTIALGVWVVVKVLQATGVL